MLALAVLVLQSVVTSAVYATDIASENEESDSVPVVETVVADEETDGSNGDEVVTNFDDSEAMATVVEESAVEKDETEVVEEVKVEEEIEEFGFQPLKLWLNLAPVLFAATEPEKSAFDNFVEKWNSAKDCENNPWFWCVKNAKKWKVWDTVNLNPKTELQPWEVWMWKLVQPGEKSWEYDVSIAIKSARAEVTTTWDAKVCAVVVFDKSKSMLEEYSCWYWRTCYREWSKWNNAVQWAIDFSTSLRNANTNSYIWLVTFSTTASPSRSLQHEVLSNSDFWSADGWTNLHAWLIEANNMLTNEMCNDANKYIVVISDGGPTYLVLDDWNVAWEWNSDAYCEEEYSKSERNSMCWWWNSDCKEWWYKPTGNETIYCTTFQNRPYNDVYKACDCKKWSDKKPSTEAINYALILKNSWIEIFSIWYETDDTANDILSSVASDWEWHFFAGDISNVASAFNNIATTVNEAVAWHDGNLVDGIGMTGSLSFADWHEWSVYTESIKEIDWEDMVYSFTIKVNDDAEEWDILTNDVNNVKLTYTDYKGEEKTIALTESASINWSCEELQHIEMVEGVYKCVSNTKKEDCKPVGIANGESIVEKVDVTWNAERKDWNATPDCTDFKCNRDYVKDDTSKTCKDDKNNNGIADDEEIYTLTVTYVKADGSEASAAHTESVLSWAEYSVTSPVVEWYVADRLTVTGTMPGENHEERVTYKVDSNGNGIADDEEDKVAITFNAWDHWSISWEVIYTTEKNLLPWVDKYPVAPEVTAEDGWKFKEWTPTYEAEKLIPLENSTIEFTATYECDEEHHEVTTENWKYCESNVQEDVKTVEICGELDPVNNTHFVKETQTISYVSWDRQKDCSVTCNDNYNPVKQADWTSEADDYMTYKCEIDTYTVTFDSNGWSAVTWQTVEYGKTATQPTNPTRNGYNFKEWRLSGSTTTFNFSTPITWDIILVAQWDKVSNWWWGGGWGWWGSTKYYDCNTGSLPANASANNTTTRESSKIDYSYGTDSWCTFQCKSGYTWNGQECTKWGGWWNNDEEIELGWQVSDKCSIEWFEWSEEEKAAYLYACENDITTIRDINEARLKDFLTRAEMAKMVSVFATKELWMKPNTSKDCSNFANSIASYNQEMKDYMVMSCQLELMWIHTVDYKAIPDFMPSKRVSRAEFGTILSRVLWWNKYEWTNSNYYINHLNALKENNIITNINPNITEYRAWVFLMLYRAVEAIKVLKSTNGVAIDQQVNEELQEEWKAETWLVVEYDSGSVVPDMATVTESWTLTTGSVAEAGAWSTVESKTGDTVTTTWDIAKDEAKVETESTTWSAN